ncbi:Mitochondrial copper homeostasis protein [Xanthoria parietina]
MGQEDDKGTTWQKAEAAFTGKRYSEYYDPCQEAADRSMRCLHRNPGSKDLCSDYFQAYRDCKKAWMTEQKEAKRKAKLAQARNQS